MKLLIATLLLSFSIVGMSQEDSPCPQIPNAKPEVQVSYDGDLSVYFLDGLKDDHKKETSNGTFQFYVDCSGVVLKSKYQSGDMSEDVQKLMLDLIKEIVWIPAEDKGRTVLANVFLIVNISNGKITVEIN